MALLFSSLLLLSSTRTFLLARVQHCQPLSQSKFIPSEYCIRFPPSPSPLPTFIFWFLFHFSRGQNRESPSSVFLCCETKRKRLLRGLFYTKYAWVLRLWTKDIDLSGGIQGRGPPPPLIFGPNWGLKSRKIYFLTPPPPPLFCRSGSATGSHASRTISYAWLTNPDRLFLTHDDFESFFLF